MKTWHIILLVVGLAVLGFVVYWFGFRKKKPIIAPPMAQPPIKNQSAGEQILSFAKSEGKKVLSDAINNWLS